MNSEGRGIVPPASVKIALRHDEVAIIKRRSIEQARHRDYQGRRNTWGLGLVGDARSQNTMDLGKGEYPIYLGLIGEHALCAFINGRLSRQVASIDMQNRRAGDNGVDLSVRGLSMQIKTRQRPEYPSMVKRVNEYGVILPLVSDVHVFCLYLREKPRQLQLLGWEWTKNLVNRQVMPAIRGNWMNIEVHDSELNPMRRLIDELRQRGDHARWD